jgi:molecular chaperone GrpE
MFLGMDKKQELINYIAQTYEMGLNKEEGGNDKIYEKCSEKLDEYVKEQNLRILAEFENYKKRTEKEKLEIRKFEKFKTLNSFLEILDDWGFFENVIEDVKETEIKTGFNLINKKVQKFLADMNIEKVDTDIPFNEDLHEAITTLDENKEPGTILKVVSNGYKIENHILKYPKVIVQK